MNFKLAIVKNENVIIEVINSGKIKNIITCFIFIIVSE
jgi:hypothetical protein